MRVKTLSINNFRNIETAQIEPDPVLSCFIGENGAGKTSILEALVVLSKGRSFRSGQVSTLIGPIKPHIQIVSSIESSSGKAHQLGMERGPAHWAVRHNQADVSQLSELTELLPFVLLEPSSYTLVNGPPDGRRKYLDWGVFHVEHGYLPLWRRYSRVLKQRNAALRQRTPDVVASLDPQFISLGEQVHQARFAHSELLVGMLNDTMPIFNRTLRDISFQYNKGWSGESLEASVAASLQRDSDRGATGPGPHRADLSLMLNGTAAKDRLSRGEQKSLTAAMLMAQAMMICSSGEKPILLLDDLASELDDEHSNNIIQAATGLGVQMWLTGTRVPEFISSAGVPNTRFHVEHGVVRKDVQC